MMAYTIRPATPVDAAIIAGHRVAMFRDMGEVPTEALAVQLLDESTAALTTWLRENVYTQPEWRGQGIARTLMNVIVKWAAEQGTDGLVLRASDAGRPFYVSLGFELTNEMRWFPTE
jgi:GNAT superfamily N-acetyltransferase